MTTIQLVILPHAEGLPPPTYQSAGASGFDVSAAIPEDAPIMIFPGDRKLIPTGLKLAIPAGFEIQVRPRSGLALTHGLTVLNTPGTVDADYRGEIRVIIANLGHASVMVNRGDRIAQLVLAPVARAGLEIVADLDATERGEAGFGSTGTGAVVVDDSDECLGCG